MDRCGSYTDLILEHGPDGEPSAGRAPTYFFDDKLVKLSNLTPEEIENNIIAVENAGINVPETEYYSVEIPVYGLGTVTAVEQELVDNPGPDFFLKHREDRWINDLRKIGYQAANANIKLDFGLDNFGMHNGELVYYDVHDDESVWTDEELSFHLMGNYLDRSIDRLSKFQRLDASEARKMAECWKNIK